MADRFTPVPLSFSDAPPARAEASGGEPSSGAAPPPFRASLDPPGRFSVYYKAQPGASFGDPDSFAKKGELIATFERIGDVVGAATAAGGGNLFSARLVDSFPFRIEGQKQKHNLRGMLGAAGVTQMGSTGPRRTETIDETSVPIRDFVGSAMRI